MAVLNFTGRKDIDRGLVEITSEKNVQPLTVYLKTDPALKSDPKFAGCDVVLEAYLRTKAERRELGAIAGLKPSEKIVFKEFLLAEGVQYRLKVVNPGDKKLAGAVDGLKEREPKKAKEDPRRRKSLLPVNWATDGDNLRNRFWKVSFAAGSKPTLLIRHGKFATLGDVNQPAFQALAFPSILREVLTYAFIVKFDNPPSWCEDWETLAKIIGEEPRPALAPGEKNVQVIAQHLEETREWIDSVAEKFAADCKLDGIDSTFRRNG